MSAIEAERACGSSVRELCAALNLRDPEGQRTAVQIVRTLFSIARAATCASPSSDVCCTPTPVDAGALGLHVPSANMPASLPAAVAALRSRMQRWRAALERPHELPACCVHDLTHVTDLATRLLACTPTEEAAFPQRATLTRVPESVFIAAPTQPSRPLRRRLRIAPDAVQVQPVLPSFAASFVACMLHVCCEASAGSPDTALIVRLLHTALRAFNRAQAVSAHDLHALPWLLAYFALDAAAESSMHATHSATDVDDASCRRHAVVVALAVHDVAAARMQLAPHTTPKGAPETVGFAHMLHAAGYLPAQTWSAPYPADIVLSAEQVEASILVRQCLEWLGQHEPAAFCVPLYMAAHTLESCASDGAPLPAYFSNAPGTGWQAAPPTVLDLTGAASAYASTPPPTPSSVAGEDTRAGAGSQGEPVADAYDGASSDEEEYATRAPVTRADWGRYAESRAIYTADQYKVSDTARTLHIGVDLDGPAGVRVRAACAGVVHTIANNRSALDYGPTVMLRHTLHVVLQAGAPARELTFYTLYGHLALSSILHPDGTPRLHVGQRVACGDTVGWLGAQDVNGGWPPHVHFQLITDCALHSAPHTRPVGDYWGVCAPRDWPAFQLLCPDPNLLIRCAFVQPVGWHASAAHPHIHHVRVLER